MLINFKSVKPVTEKELKEKNTLCLAGTGEEKEPGGRWK